MNDAQQAFHQTYIGLYDSCFPVKTVKVGYQNKKQPWLTLALKKSIKINNKLYVKSLKYPTVRNINGYKEYKCLLNGPMK